MNEDTGNNNICQGCGEECLELTFHDCPNGWWSGGPDLLNPGYAVSGRKL